MYACTCMYVCIQKTLVCRFSACIPLYRKYAPSALVATIRVPSSAEEIKRVIKTGTNE